MPKPENEQPDLFTEPEPVEFYIIAVEGPWFKVYLGKIVESGPERITIEVGQMVRRYEPNDLLPPELQKVLEIHNVRRKIRRRRRR
jgi:hypothetical protein